MLNDYNEDKKKFGYIYLWRALTEWEWYTDINVKVLFIHLLLKVNHKDKTWRGIEIKRGSFLTSREVLAFETGLSEMQVRTALKKLKNTNEIEIKTTSQYSIITVNNYKLYQNNNQQNNQQVTNEYPTNNQQVTTTNNDKEMNNNEEEEGKNSTSSTSDISDLNKERIEDLKNFYGEYKNVHLTSKQLDALKTMILNDSLLNELIQELSENIEQGKEKIFDAKRPGIHFVRLKKYWQYRQNIAIENNKKEEDSYNYGF